MRRAISSTILALSCAAIFAAEHPQDDQQKAAALWEQAVDAKGGRDRLYGIRSVAIQERTRFRNLMLRDVTRGKIDQIVCEFPDGWWEFLDYRPGLMGYSVSSVNARTGLGWTSSGGPARPLMRPDTFVPYRIRQLQYVYFLETRWVRPTPLRASRVRRGFKSVDRVETMVEGELVSFDLDVNTHLPVRIETIHKTKLKPPRPGMTGSGGLTFVYELDAYHDVAGIQVPARVTRGSDTAEADVEINPDYDPAIFTTPPPAGATMTSWRRSSN